MISSLLQTTGVTSLAIVGKINGEICTLISVLYLFINILFQLFD